MEDDTYLVHHCLPVMVTRFVSMSIWHVSSTYFQVHPFLRKALLVVSEWLCGNSLSLFLLTSSNRMHFVDNLQFSEKKIRHRCIPHERKVNRKIGSDFRCKTTLMRWLVTICQIIVNGTARQLRQYSRPLDRRWLSGENWDESSIATTGADWKEQSAN